MMYDMIIALVEHGADVNFAAKNGMTPVCSGGILNGDVKLINTLVGCGADSHQ